MITLQINNQEVSVAEGSTIAAAVYGSGTRSFRQSISGEARFPLCGMGICFECRVSVNGVKHQRSCQILAENEMIIETD